MEATRCNCCGVIYLFFGLFLQRPSVCVFMWAGRACCFRKEAWKAKLFCLKTTAIGTRRRRRIVGKIVPAACWQALLVSLQDEEELKVFSLWNFCFYNWAFFSWHFLLKLLKEVLAKLSFIVFLDKRERREKILDNLIYRKLKKEKIYARRFKKQKYKFPIVMLFIFLD